MSQVNRHHSRKLTLLLVGMGVLLLAAMAASWWLQRLTDAAQESRHASSARLLMLEKALASLVRAEAAQRGFLITEDSRHIAAWRAAAADARAQERQLAELYAGNAGASELLAKLKHWNRMKLEDLEDAIEAYNNMGRELAVSLLQANSGTQFMVQIQRAMRELEAAEEARNASLQAQVASHRKATYSAAAVLFVLAVAGCVIVHGWIGRESAAREREAFHDALTQLPNRRNLVEELDRTVERARRHRRVVSLLFVDLDGFKHVNDCLGHACGDVLLQRASERFRQTVRQADFLARLGGDEFAIVMETAGREHAAALGARLVECLAAPLIADHPEHAVSASIGIAVFPDEAQDSAALLARADQAMYLAKRQGKGRVASLDCPEPAAAAA